MFASGSSSLQLHHCKRAIKREVQPNIYGHTSLLWALWGPIHYFQGYLFFFMLKSVHNNIGCMFGVVILLQNKFGSNHTTLRWYGMMNKYLPENCHSLCSKQNILNKSLQVFTSFIPLLCTKQWLERDAALKMK